MFNHDEAFVGMDGDAGTGQDPDMLGNRAGLLAERHQGAGLAAPGSTSIIMARAVG